MLDGYFHSKGHHINVNVFDRETLMDAMDRQRNTSFDNHVSGYAVNFVKLNREQQLDIIRRTFHER